MTRAIDVAGAGTLEAMLVAYVEAVIDPSMEAMPIDVPPSRDAIKLSSMMDFVGGAMGALTLLRELSERPKAPPLQVLLQKVGDECRELHVRLNPDLYRKKDGS